MPTWNLTYYMILTIWHSRKGKPLETVKRLSGWGKENKSHRIFRTVKVLSMLLKWWIYVIVLFQILKEDAVWRCQQIWNTQQWPKDWKRSVFIPIPKKSNAKESSSYHKILLISHASMIMLKILQVRLQQYVNQELPNVPAGFRKGRGTRDQNANSVKLDHRKSKGIKKKKSTFASLTTLKPFTV